MPSAFRFTGAIWDMIGYTPDMNDLTPAPKGYPIKLVWDKTPAILNSTGKPGTLWYGPCEGDLGRLLRKKLGEEVTEYLVDGGLGELRDVLSVVAALAKVHGSDLEELTALSKADPRGPIESGVMMYGHHEEFDGHAD